MKTDGNFRQAARKIINGQTAKKKAIRIICQLLTGYVTFLKPDFSRFIW